MQDNETVTLVFDRSQLAVINAGLQELAFKHAAPLINDINRQIAEQRRQDGQTELKVVEGGQGKGAAE